MYSGKRGAGRINLFWGRTHSLWICNMVDGLGPHFLLTESMIQ